MSIENIMAGAADAIKAQYESAKKHVGEAVDSVAHSSLAEKVSKAVAEIFAAFQELAQAIVSFGKSLFERKVEVFTPPAAPEDAKFYQAPQPVVEPEIAPVASLPVSVEGVEDSEDEVSNEDSSDEVEDEVSSEISAPVAQGILPGGCVKTGIAPAPSYKKAALKAAVLTGSVAALGYAAYKAYDEGYFSEENFDQVQAYVKASMANVTLPQMALPAALANITLPAVAMPNIDLSGVWAYFGHAANSTAV